MENNTSPECSRGHDLAEAGTYTLRGRSVCRKCHRDDLRMSAERLAALRSHPEHLIEREVGRFLAKFDRPSEGCWIWKGTDQGAGYGVFQIAGKSRLAHRVSYRQYRGDFDDSLEIDHLCRNTKCVRPDHLEPVSKLENIARGTMPPAVYLRTGACIRGHQDDFYVCPSSGKKTCRACNRAHKRGVKRGTVVPEPIAFATKSVLFEQ